VEGKNALPSFLLGKNTGKEVAAVKDIAITEGKKPTSKKGRFEK